MRLSLSALVLALGLFAVAAQAAEEGALVEAINAYRGEVQRCGVHASEPLPPLASDARLLLPAAGTGDLQQALSGSLFAGLTGLSPVTTEGLIQASHELGLAIRTALGRSIMNRAEQSAAQRHLSSVRTILRDGDPATELLATIVKEKPDLFVIGRRGLGAIQRLLIGSVSSKVSQAAECTIVLAK